MSDDMLPTPEGRLIRRARERAIPKLTIRAAAARISMSAEQWGYVERGYTPSRGGEPPRRFHPPAPTLARMASALDVTPGELEASGENGGERPDAAERLREILHRRPEPSTRLSAVPAVAALEGLPEGEEELLRMYLAASPKVQDAVQALMITQDDRGNPRPWRQRRETIMTILRLAAGRSAEENDKEA